jgi:hypothetical protein
VKIDINSEEFEKLPLLQKLLLIEERKKEIYREIENIFQNNRL